MDSNATPKTPRKTMSRRTLDSNATPKTPIRRTKISQAVCDDQCKVVETITPRRSTRKQQQSSTIKAAVEITPKTRIEKSNTKSSTKKKAACFLSPEPPKFQTITTEKKSAVKIRQTFHVESTVVSNEVDKNATIHSMVTNDNIDENSGNLFVIEFYVSMFS